MNYYCNWKEIKFDKHPLKVNNLQITFSILFEFHWDWENDFRLHSFPSINVLNIIIPLLAWLHPYKHEESLEKCNPNTLKTKILLSHRSQNTHVWRENRIRKETMNWEEVFPVFCSIVFFNCSFFKCQSITRQTTRY